MAIDIAKNEGQNIMYAMGDGFADPSKVFNGDPKDMQRSEDVHESLASLNLQKAEISGATDVGVSNKVANVSETLNNAGIQIG